MKNKTTYKEAKQECLDALEIILESGLLDKHQKDGKTYYKVNEEKAAEYKKDKSKFFNDFYE